MSSSRSPSRLLLAVAAALAFAPAARADAPSAGASGDILFEVDPATFALGGFSAHLRVRSPHLALWTFGAGTYAMDLPGPLVDLEPSNRNEGWRVRIRSGAALFVDRFIGESPRGLFAGLELGVQRLRLTNRRATAEAAEYTAVLVMPRAGYLWHPFSSGFYLMPWLAAGWAARTAGSATLAGRTYHVPSFPLFATLHLGWRY